MEQRIKVRLAVIGKTASELAEEAGVSPSTLSQLMSNKLDARLSTVARLEAALGVPAGWLTMELTVQEITAQAGTFPAPGWAMVAL